MADIRGGLEAWRLGGTASAVRRDPVNLLLGDASVPLAERVLGDLRLSPTPSRPVWLRRRIARDDSPL
jgi:hypothetical protein